MIKKYADIVYEYFDPSNSTEFRALMNLNEEQQDRVLANLATKLYDHIVNEITDIDFGDIPTSKGDITRIPNYLDMVDCINIIHDICVRFKQPTTATDTLFKAIQNLKDTKEIWRKSFDIKAGLGMNTYNTLALGIVCSVSLLISSAIEFIKNQEGDFEFLINKVGMQKSLDSVLFKSLKEFNDGCTDGTFMKAIIIANNSKVNISEAEVVSFDEAAMIDTLVRTAKEFINSHGPDFMKNGFNKAKAFASDIAKGKDATMTGAGIVTGIGGLIVIVAVLLPTIRNAVHWFFSSKQKLSDYFAIQASLLEINANNVKYMNSKSSAEKEKIAEKQMKWVSRFREISNKLSVNMSKAEKSAKNKLEQESNQKLTMNDVEKPSNVSALF
jgi:hypothetical protein